MVAKLMSIMENVDASCNMIHQTIILQQSCLTIDNLHTT